MRRPRTVLLAAVAALAAALPAAQPASASVPRPDLPCRVDVPAKVVLTPQGGTVTGRRGTCPSLLRQVYWQFQGPRGSGFSLHYDADALYPARGLSEKIYAFQGPGRYRLEPLQTATFEDPSVGEFGEFYEVPLTASNDVVAKFAASAAVSVAHRGTGARRTTTLTVRGRRAAAYTTEAAAGQGVRLLRDGRLLRTGVLSSSGAASWTFADRTGAHSYVAVLPETSRTWSATSPTARG